MSLDPSRARPAELVLRVRVPYGEQCCAFGYADRLFRPERCTWEGPALVSWFGKRYPSGEPLMLADPGRRSGPPRARDGLAEPDEQSEPPTESDVRQYRVHKIGEPVCLVVYNPTGIELKVELRVTGTAI